MKHRFVRRVSALALAGCLLAGSSLPAFAAASAAKEEVIYANLTASGAVTGVYAVNSFSVQAGDTVADHGSYTAVRNMTTSDAVEQSGDTVTVHVTEDGKLYYEGTMDAATALPWVVKLTYTLDGAEISPDELGGKSGALSIRLQVSRNPDCTGSFFDDYALQVTMSLDTELARNISAPGATVANVGSKKQLSYILLPGADSDVTVTADVTDFAMDAVSLNGVRLNLNLDLGDMDLTGMLEQLQSGSVQLDDGANALADGIAQVQAGIDTLNGNSAALTGGSARVRGALTQMQTALNGISASTDELNTLLDASTQIRDGIARLDEGAAQLEQQVSFEAYKAILKENGLDLDVVKEGNAKAIQQLQGMVWMMPQLKDVILLLQGSTANIDAMQTYLDTVNGGIAQLHEGSSTLNGSYGEFDAGVRQLAGVLTGMLGNLSVLTDGVNQLAAQYVQLDNVLNAPLVPGVMDVLERWHGRVPMYVCSGTPQEELQSVLEQRGLARYFTGICGTPPAKAELLKGIVRKERIDPADAVMVGDATTDSDAAEAAETLFYGRGPFFENTAYPHGSDLTGLNRWLEELAGKE